MGHEIRQRMVDKDVVECIVRARTSILEANCRFVSEHMTGTGVVDIYAEAGIATPTSR